MNELEMMMMERRAALRRAEKKYYENLSNAPNDSASIEALSRYEAERRKIDRWELF